MGSLPITYKVSETFVNMPKVLCNLWQNISALTFSNKKQRIFDSLTNVTRTMEIVGQLNEHVFACHTD